MWANLIVPTRDTDIYHTFIIFKKMQMVREKSEEWKMKSFFYFLEEEYVNRIEKMCYKPSLRPWKGKLVNVAKVFFVFRRVCVLFICQESIFSLWCLSVILYSLGFTVAFKSHMTCQTQCIIIREVEGKST